jgi:hypothetical protein
MKSSLLARCRFESQRFMNLSSWVSSRSSLVARSWLVSLAMLTGSWAVAQNFVRNPDFESPLGPDNWKIVYVNGSSESDFFIHGRSTIAHRDSVYGTWDGNYFGLHFRPYTQGLMEAYASQTVSNLSPNASYVVSVWMTQFHSNYTNKMNLWLESIGGLGSLSSANAIGYMHDDNSNTDNNGWSRYWMTNTANSAGQIEVRLHFQVIAGTTSGNSSPKWMSEDAFYDHVSVMPAESTGPPPFRILSVGLTNEVATLTWETVVNNTYQVEFSSDFSSWSRLTNKLVALGTNMTFTTGTSGFPGAPDAPQFFRILSEDYVP